MASQVYFAPGWEYTPPPPHPQGFSDLGLLSGTCVHEVVLLTKIEGWELHLDHKADISEFHSGKKSGVPI